MTQEPKNWIIRKSVFDKTFLANLQEKTQMSTAMLQFLCNRGFLTKELINDLLQPEDRSDFLNYQEGQKLLEIVKSYRNKNIMLYSDFDCDGICAAVIAEKGLKSLGFNPQTYFNSRFAAGYGFKEEAISWAQKNDCQLIICLDQGINDADSIKQALDQGLAVVIIDHHKPGSELPPATAIVDPCCVDTEESEVAFCAGALAFQFIKALAVDLGQVADFSELLPYVALCCLSDVMELRGSNRHYVKAGLQAINQSSLPAFQVFKDQLQKTITADDLRYSLAPQINAVGRMTDDVRPAFMFLASSDYHQAADYYQIISAINKERQFLTKIQLAQAQKQLDARSMVNIVVGDFHQGLLGILAGRIASNSGKVTLVASQQNEQIIASVRGVAGNKLQESLAAVSEYLLQYGGHDLAAGLTLKKEQLADFIAAFSSQITSTANADACYLDIVYQTRYIQDSDISQWELLEPYGPGFEYPIFGLVVENYQYQILKNEHLKISTANIDILAFNCRRFLPVLQTGKALKVLVKFERDRFNKYQAVLLEEDIRLLK